MEVIGFAGSATFPESNALSLKNERIGGDLTDVRKFGAVTSRPSVFAGLRLLRSSANRLATAFGQYSAAKQRAERYQKSILPKARESHRLTLAAFRGGQFEYLRVLQAQRAIGEANLSYIQALSEQWRAASEIAGLLQEEHWPLSLVQPGGLP